MIENRLRLFDQDQTVRKRGSQTVDDAVGEVSPIGTDNYGSRKVEDRSKEAID